jgi:hypothetical protein
METGSESETQHVERRSHSKTDAQPSVSLKRYVFVMTLFFRFCSSNVQHHVHLQISPLLYVKNLPHIGHGFDHPISGFLQPDAEEGLDEARLVDNCGESRFLV